MPNSRKGTNFKEFASTMRYPPLEFDNPNSSGPFSTPRAQLLGGIASEVRNEFLKSIFESEIDFVNGKVLLNGQDDSKSVFKNLGLKLKEDQELKNPAGKMAKAALINKANLEGGDIYATTLNYIIDSFTGNETGDSYGIFKKDTPKVVRQALLKSVGIETLKFFAMLGVSGLARAVPIEQLTQFNVEQYIKMMDPFRMLDAMIAGLEDKTLASHISDYRALADRIYVIVESSVFVSLLIQQRFMDFLKAQPDSSEEIKQANFEQVKQAAKSLSATADASKELNVTTNALNDIGQQAATDPKQANADLNALTSEKNIKQIARALRDYINDSNAGINKETLYNELMSKPITPETIFNLSNEVSGLVSGAQDDIQEIFDSFENCELPNPDIFAKYRPLSPAERLQYPEKITPISIEPQTETAAGSESQSSEGGETFKFPDRHEFIESMKSAAMTALFYVMTKIAFKIVIAYLQKLVPDLSCASISAMLPIEEMLGPKNQNKKPSVDDAASKIAETIRLNNPSLSSFIKLDDIKGLLTEIATSIGVFKGTDINVLNEFVSLATGVLTDREYCELIRGVPGQDTITIIQSIIDTRYQGAGISRAPEDITRLFVSIASLTGSRCEQTLTSIEMPINSMYCSTPEYYRLYTELRTSLLKEKGLSDDQVAEQVRKACDLNSQQIRQLMDFVNSDNPISDMIPAIESSDCGASPLEAVNEAISQELVRSYKNVFTPLKQMLDVSMIGDSGFLSSVLACKHNLPYPKYLQIIEKANSDSSFSTFINSIDEQEAEKSQPPTTLFSDIQPKRIASWLRMNQEEFCSLSFRNRLGVSPFTEDVDPFSSSTSFELSDEDRTRIKFISSLTPEQVQSLPASTLLTYEDLFSRLGNINFGLRSLSFTGIYDSSQSSIGKLSVDGIRQVNLEAGALTENLQLNPKFIALMLLTFMVPYVGNIASNNIMSTSVIPRTVVARKKDGTLKNSPALPGINKKISSAQPDYRIKSHNFFILPLAPTEMQVGTIKTKIIDHYPPSLIESSLLEKELVDPNNFSQSTSVTIDFCVTHANKMEFMAYNKEYELLEITKQPNDYLFDVTQESVSTPVLTQILNDSELSGSKQSLLFAELVMNALQNNLGIEYRNIPKAEKFIEYLRKDLFNYTFNSFLDGMMKTPALNGKNFNYGVTDQRVNPLNGLHTNTITGELDPVDPGIFGGTEINPSYYLYNRLSDDWKNIYNLYMRTRGEQYTPTRTALPDFESFAEQSAKIYLKLKEEFREAKDYSNQTPFDLIVSKASMVSMDGFIEMMMKVFTFEHYYKGFAFLNTVEMNENVFDNVYFDFLAKRFADYLVSAGPTSLSRNRRVKTKRFYYMVMEIYVMLLLKKKEAKLGSFTVTEEEILRQILRKANIWKVGTPKDNLTEAESSYLNSYAEIAKYEAPGYPIGSITSAVASSGGSLGPMNKIFAEAKKQRTKQIEVRDQLWTRIMEDCEPLFEQLLRIRFKTEMNVISEQLTILNPNLIKENNIITMPINGGPIVQSGEDITNDNTHTAHMRNVYSYQPSLLYSAGNILISDIAYRAFYGSKEDNNDRNFNGFMFNRLYSKQNFYGENAAFIKAEPKEPVYEYEAVERPGVVDDYEEKTDLLKLTETFYYSNTRDRSNEFGDVKMDDLKYSPYYLNPNLLNFIELNKRDITTNYFLLNSKYTKAGIEQDWDNMFIFQDEAYDIKDLEMKLTESNNYGVSDYYLNLDQISRDLLDLSPPPEQYPGVRTFYQSVYNVDSVENQKYAEFLEPIPSKGKENIDNSIKRYKVFKNTGAVINKFGIDGLLVGGKDASNMPIVLSQVPAPIVLEQYLNLVEPSGIDTPRTVESGLFTETLEKLRTILYNFDNNSDVRFRDNTYRSVNKNLFRGPVSLTSFIYWLGSSGFLVNLDGTDPEYIDLEIKEFFEPGTFKYGVRLMLLQPNSDLTFQEGTHTYFEEEFLNSIIAPTSETPSNVSTLARDKKAFSKSVGYSIPLFKAEEEVNWTFRDLKNIYNSYLSFELVNSSYNNVIPEKWIDHVSLTRPINIRLFNQIICSEDYKKMFDFCIPLRYFASLSAIYTTKGFTDSIGSAVDWGGRKRVKGKVFSRREKDILLPFYQEMRKVFYQSYNSFDPSYDGEIDDLDNIVADEEKQNRISRPATSVDRDSLIRISEIQSDILTANRVDPNFKEGLGDMEKILRDSYVKSLIPDPTNACGSAKDKDVC